MRKGQIMSEEQKKKIVVTRRKNGSYFMSEYTKKKLIAANTGRKQTEEHKRKISESNKKVIHTPEWNKNVSLANKGKVSWVKGKHLSDEWKKKISLGNKGRKHSKEIREKMSKAHLGQISWSKGKTGIYSEETIRKMSMAHKGKKHKPFSRETRKKMSDYHKSLKEKNWNWKGGTSPLNKKIRRSLDFKFWREAVFGRDNYTCQKCKERGGELHPHHILNFGKWLELRFDLKNGITLCRKCHFLFHNIYGKTNNTREQLDEFMAKQSHNN